MSITSPKILSLVIPVYYNGETIPFLFEELRKLEEKLGQKNISVEIIAVNDGSGDDSLARLLEEKKKRPATKVISLSRNFGSIAAIGTGFKYVTGDVFGFLAADLQDPPEQLLPMIEHWLQGKKLVISARAARHDPLTTRIFAWIYYRLVEWFVTRNYPKGGFDLMLMDKSILPHLVSRGKNTNPMMYAVWLGFDPVILKYTRQKRAHGQSRWTFIKKLNFLIDTLTGFSVAPIRLMSAIGAVAAIIGFLNGVRIIVLAFTSGIPVAGFATLAVLVTFFSGLVLMMLGVIGEYLWRVFDAVNNKPESVIDETFL